MGVVAMQVLIIIEGGHGGRLPEFQHCLSDDLERAINCSMEANWNNVTIPVSDVPFNHCVKARVHVVVSGCHDSTFRFVQVNSRQNFYNRGLINV